MGKKNDITYENRCKIIDAILYYKIKCIDSEEEALVDNSDMESYDKTLYRLWDWGYTRILPEEKYEIIKPFIKE